MLAGSNKGRLVPTDTGMIVNDFLTEFFPNVLDYNFTANIEEKFDDIASGQIALERGNIGILHRLSPCRR